MVNLVTPDPDAGFTEFDLGATRARCSPAQDYFWRLDAQDPGTPSLNIAVKWRIRGHLDAAMTQEAFQAIIERHEALRTALVGSDGQPVQLLVEHLPFKLSEIDLSGLPEADRAGEAERIGGLEACMRFDLAQAPLLRATLVRLSRTEAVLLVTAHHTVSDGWSMGILAKDFVRAYQALSRGARPSFPELPLQYSDYAEWSQEGLSERMLGVEAGYWKTRLADLPYVAVPPDHLPSVSRSAEGATIARLLPKPLTAKLAELARGEDTTFFTAAYAVLLVLMSQRTAATDIVLSTQMAARDEVELESVVGPFVNTLVLRTQVKREQSFLALCRDARDTFEEAVEHHLWPIGRVVPRHSGGLQGRPPVSVNFIVQRAFIGELANDSFKLSGIPSNLPGALYDLNFILVEREEGWRLTCEYHRDLYDETTAAGLVAQYERIAEAVVANPTGQLPGAHAPAAGPASRPAPVARAEAAGERQTAPQPTMRKIWLQQAGAQPALFALNHTAQNLNQYRPLSRELGPGQPFATLQLLDPSVDGRAPMSIQELAAIYCDAIIAARPSGRLRLAGFCRSGVIAYEAARQLSAAGREIDLVILIDCWAPGYFLRQPYRARLLFRLRRTGRFGRRLWRGGPRSFATRMSFWLQSTAAVRRAKRLVFWRPSEEAADEAEFWRATDELEALVQRYTPSAYSGPVLLFRSEGIPAGWPPDPALGWSEHLADATPCLSVPGEGHQGAFSAAGSRWMADGIKDELRAIAR